MDSDISFHTVPMMVFAVAEIPNTPFQAWAVCCTTADHVMIFLKIVAFKFLDSLMYMTE